MGQVYLNGPRVPKSYPKKKKQEKPKSKLGLPRVTIRGQIIPQPKSPKWLRKDRLHEYLWATRELL